MVSLGGGVFWALLGAALAAGLAGAGSAKGVGIAGEAAAGVFSEEPDRFTQTLILQALPGTQGIYGLLIAALILDKIGLFAGHIDANFSLASGLAIFAASLPIAITGYFSGIAQGRASAASINIIAKRPDDLSRAMIYPAMVETYAVFGLLISVLMLK